MAEHPAVARLREALDSYYEAGLSRELYIPDVFDAARALLDALPGMVQAVYQDGRSRIAAHQYATEPLAAAARASVRQEADHA